jgi:hypothetical protein
MKTKNYLFIDLYFFPKNYSAISTANHQTSITSDDDVAMVQLRYANHLSLIMNFVSYFNGCYKRAAASATSVSRRLYVKEKGQ